jgi:hypothetical protein
MWPMFIPRHMSQCAPHYYSVTPHLFTSEEVMFLVMELQFVIVSIQNKFASCCGLLCHSMVLSGMQVGAHTVGMGAVHSCDVCPPTRSHGVIPHKAAP